jgi:Flp pilus assembly protein TadB
VFVIVGRIIAAAARSADRNEAAQWRAAAVAGRLQPHPQPQQQAKVPERTATITPPQTGLREQVIEEKIKPSTGRKVVKGFGIAILIFGAFMVLVGVVGESFVLGALIFGIALIILGLLMIRVVRVRTIKREVTTEGEAKRRAARMEGHDEDR